MLWGRHEYLVLVGTVMQIDPLAKIRWQKGSKRLMRSDCSLLSAVVSDYDSTIMSLVLRFADKTELAMACTQMGEFNYGSGWETKTIYDHLTGLSKSEKGEWGAFVRTWQPKLLKLVKDAYPQRIPRRGDAVQELWNEQDAVLACCRWLCI